MAVPQQYKITTLTEFVEAIETSLQATLTNQVGGSFRGNWYRGIGNVSHKLKPTLYRHPSVTDAKELLQLEKIMLEQFERQNVLHQGIAGGLGSSAGDDGEFRSLFYMQHYGVPTRLLDWTSNPMIALYFALSSAKKEGAAFSDDAAVWVLDPVTWNRKALENLAYDMQGPMSIGHEYVKGYRPRKLVQGKLLPQELIEVYDRPVAMLGVSNNARIFAQKGVFTMFGKDTTPMEVQYDSQSFPAGCLTQIVVPAANIELITERLLTIGYTDSVSYPDLHGLAMEIKRMNGFAV